MTHAEIGTISHGTLHAAENGPISAGESTDDHEFCNAPCDIRGTRAAGYRHAIVTLEQE